MIDWSKVQKAKTPEELEAERSAKLREELKAQREAAVAAIKVTTHRGNTFDGDETSQLRMGRAYIAMLTKPLGYATEWTLADNSVVKVTKEELQEALVLAGQAQTALWDIN